MTIINDDFIPPFAPGCVWLAGAGPGDPGLLTLQTYVAIKNADVIVYDALVSQPIMQLTSPNAMLDFVGKRGGQPSCRQEDIITKLIDYAKSNLRVLRLKGGDPMIFGRGAEEAQALAKINIPFRILPGITAGIGGIAYAGISATHRDINSAVTFITGHALNSTLNWRALSEGSTILIIYMGLKNLVEIAKILIKHGRDTSEALTIIINATMPSQLIIKTTLANASQAMDHVKQGNPAIIVIGKAANIPMNILGSIIKVPDQTTPAN